MANPLSSVVKALGGGIKPVGQVHVPKFGPTVKQPLAPAPMSVGNAKAYTTTRDMLSRPSRPRRSGYKKTAPDLGKASSKVNLSAPPAAPGPGLGL